MNKLPDVPVRQIAKLAHQYYPSLPPAARAFMDVEDLISHGVIRWLEFRPKYDPKRAGLSTFTHHVIRSWFLEIIRSYKRARYPQLPIVSLEDTQVEDSPSRSHLERNTGAHARMERFFQLASPQVRVFLQENYFSGERDFRQFRRADQQIRTEIAWLVERIGLSANDFRACAAASVRIPQRG